MLQVYPLDKKKHGVNNSSQIRALICLAFFFSQSICEPMHAIFLILTHVSKSLEKLPAVCCPDIVVKPDSSVLIIR